MVTLTHTKAREDTTMKKENWNCTEYKYRGYYIYKVTRRDYCVYNESGCIIDTLTLKEAKAEINRLLDR